MGFHHVDSHCVIDVADCGGGIPPEARQRIFEPFFTTKERGTRLGLAVSRRIVAAHQGEVRVTPRAGGGTLVEIVLPTPSPAVVQGES